VRHAGKDIGSDNAEIFGALGLSADEIAALEQDDII
jgi:crotonobetainyl-CoA:carnitine CoA-transferase CaiB-like acyl-CoA transferase